MRILLVGQPAFAEQVLQGLEAAGHQVAGVVCPPDRGDKVDPVKAAAVARDVPVQQFPSLKSAEAGAAFASAGADLAVLAYVTQIVPEALLQLQPSARVTGFDQRRRISVVTTTSPKRVGC